MIDRRNFLATAAALAAAGRLNGAANGMYLSMNGSLTGANRRGPILRDWRRALASAAWM